MNRHRLTFRSRRATRRRRFLIALALVAGLALIPVAVAALRERDEGRRSQATPTGALVLRLSGTQLARLELAPFVRAERLDRRRLARALRRSLPQIRSVRRGRHRITYRLDRSGAVETSLKLGTAGGTVEVPARAVSASITAPVVAQRLRNNCETAALAIMLATAGTQVDQLRLQRALGRDGPLDPIGSGAARRWGDPELGYVGRPTGGGVAGGFGVYPGPVADLARRYGLRLTDLTRSPAGRVYRELRQGRAVMAWVGLSDGPYGEWLSPRGRVVRVNFGEHTVVLNGIRSDGSVRVVNPLKGTREVWSRARFELMWDRLGRRALVA